jgi:hypothetical protein
MAPAARRETAPVFRHLVGTYRTISAFDERGLAELWIRIREGRFKGRHWVAIEPSLLRLPLPKRATSRASGRATGAGRRGAR